MRRLTILLCVVTLGFSSGCATYEGLFSVFGDGYSGGTNRRDKEQQFSAEVNQYGR